MVNEGMMEERMARPNRPYRLVGVMAEDGEIIQYQVVTLSMKSLGRRHECDAGKIYKTSGGNWMFSRSGGPGWAPSAEEAAQEKANDWFYSNRR